MQTMQLIRNLYTYIKLGTSHLSKIPRLIPPRNCITLEASSFDSLPAKYLFSIPLGFLNKPDQNNHPKNLLNYLMKKYAAAECHKAFAVRSIGWIWLIWITKKKENDSFPNPRGVTIITS